MTVVVVCGSPGSGKTALCHALVKLLGGQYLSEDELNCASKNKNIFHLFLQSLESTASRANLRYIFVDSRAASRKSSREGIISALSKGFLRSKETQNHFGDSIKAKETASRSRLKLIFLSLTGAETEETLFLHSRILKRSLRHIAFIPQAAHVKSTIQAICEEFDDLTVEEREEFDKFAMIDPELPLSSMVFRALDALGETATLEGVLSALYVAEKNEERIMLKWTTLYWMLEAVVL